MSIFLAARMRDWLQFNKFKMTVKDALIKLNDLVDESDPDTNLPNIIHAFQTAESVREKYPDLGWFHLTGLIHDLGKVRRNIKVSKNISRQIIYFNNSYLDARSKKSVF